MRSYIGVWGNVRVSQDRRGAMGGDVDALWKDSGSEATEVTGKLLSIQRRLGDTAQRRTNRPAGVHLGVHRVLLKRCVGEGEPGRRVGLSWNGRIQGWKVAVESASSRSGIRGDGMPRLDTQATSG
jgi:hypothetical protein